MNKTSIVEALAEHDISFEVGVLAGGLGSRMGGRDKGLQNIDDAPLIKHTIDQLSPLVQSEPFISCNRNMEQYRKFSSRVFQDVLGGFKGPMAGIHALLRECQADYLLIFPCDTPYCSKSVADALLERLLEQIQTGSDALDFSIAVISNGKKQPLHALIPKTLYAALEDALNQNQHKMVRWLDEQNTIWLDYACRDSEFKNINTLEQLKEQSRN